MTVARPLFGSHTILGVARVSRGENQDLEWRRALDAGRSALEAGDLAEADELLASAAAESEVPEVDEARAQLSEARGDPAGARGWLERAFRGYRNAGQRPSAIRVAAGLARVHYGFLGNLAAAKGWQARGRRLAAEHGPCLEEGYLELALLACWESDIDALTAASERALRIARDFDDVDLEVRALADSGLALVSAGRITEGLSRLDEAGAAVTAGEVANPRMTSAVFCAILSAAARTGDAARAGEWTRLFEEHWSERGLTMAAYQVSHCRSEYGAALCTCGRWDQAEVLLQEAVEAGRRSSPVTLWEGLSSLVSLRVLQGRVEEAAALLEGWEDRLELAEASCRVALGRGEADRAVATALSALRKISGDRLRAVPLWALVVEAAVAGGDLDRAAEAAESLALAASQTEISSLAAEARLAVARVAAARGESEAAAAECEAALACLGDVERPLLAGAVHLELARVVASTDASWSEVEARAALAIFNRLGAEMAAAAARSHLRTLGARVADGGTSALAELTERELDVARLVAAGLSNQEIARRLYLSPKTIEHHVGRILAKLGLRRRGEVAAALVRIGGR
ncbi:helix-turn-helix transcriptional regulator [Amycolatopsis thermophila]|uniref:DNA-binding NarL/FixJ family response regulator/Tfp pilus assembly protein PilF n=1 Tax=Amycolatopsis thermophila TaxID=206084 RepID=A0ABU0ERT6_9PSEU|nr:helix-turn-helix transcriptional regulator [Amycolatopsis thermophila]MDQ0377874.1 DNA-binding NarL/FixJ family response regulator/Tfp pilus assembly protein PilF [Amycolatopsis thermophila]